MPLFKSAKGEATFMEAYDAVLRDWPVPYEELDLPTCLGKTHVIASGRADAPPLFLLPSMAGTATLWRPNVAALSERYRTYAVDVIGQVGKSVPIRRIQSRQDFAQWFVDLLDALGITRTSIVGNSYGGFLAMNQASLTPSRVECVILVSPAGTFVGGLRWVFLRAMLKRIFMRPKQREITDLLGKGARLDPRDAAWGALMSVTLSQSARPNLVAPIVFSKAQLAAISAPVLLLVGAKEVMYDPDSTLKLAMERMPGLSGAVIPHAHHLAALASPDEVNARILEFLKRNQRTGQPDQLREESMQSVPARGRPPR
jgi:pimeloyl-ACP methyl ester carboxylesterase